MYSKFVAALVISVLLSGCESADVPATAPDAAIYKTYLPQKPARTTFAAEALAAGAKIEIEVVAVKKK